MDQLKKAALQLKEKIENKSPLEKALGEATSDVNWNASNKLLQEIADHTYSFGDFAEVMKYIWRKISSERKQWRRILKTLNLIEYLIKNGSPRCIQEFRDEIYQIRTLQDFAHYEDGQDRGAGIRETSKRVVQLLNDEAKIDEERKKAQEIRERLGDMRGIGSGGERTGGYGGYSGSGSGSHGGSTSSYGGTGSGSYGGSGSNVPKYGGYSNKDSGMGPSKSGSGYDDTRKVGSWRVDKSTAEESNKHKDDHHDSHTAKSGTKFEADFTEKKTDTNKQVPTLAGPGQTKKFAPPKGMKGNTTTTTTTSAQDVNLFDDITSAPSTNNNAQVQGNMFDWSAPTQNQPQTQAPAQQANNNEWAWNAPTGNPTPQQTTTGTNKTQGDPFGWGEPQTSAPVQSNTNITNLYQQQPQTQAPPFGFNSTPAQNTNNLANQFGGLSFNSTPSQPTTGFNAFGTPQQSAPVQNFNANPSPQKTDLFDDFQTAKPGTNDYKNYSNAEKSIIDLSDLAGEANKKKDKDNKLNQNKNSNDGFLYSTQSDLDSFFVAGQQNAGMNMGGFNQGGMGMQQGNMGGFNQGGMGHGMGGGMNMGGMGGMGMQQGNMGGYGQMGGFNQGGMGMQQGNMGGFNNMGGMQGGFGNQNMNQMGGMNQGYGGFR